MSDLSDKLSFAVETLENSMDAPTFVFNGKSYRGLSGSDPAALAMQDAGWAARGQITLTVRTSVFGSATPPVENSPIMVNGRLFTVTRLEFTDPSQDVVVYTLNLRT